jgi:hypothetical protein
MRDAETRKERRARKRAAKPSFSARMKSRGKEAMHLGNTLVREPREFPNATLAVVRKSFRTLWKARGGGFYACGFVITFVFLEVRMFIGEFIEAESIGDFFGEQIFEMLFKFLGESIQNTVYAFIWPVRFFEYRQPWGLLTLGALYLLFAYILKEPIERWLFHDDVKPGDVPGA